MSRREVPYEFRRLSDPEPVILDYKGARDPSALLRNLSGIASDGEFLWTVSDEGRTLERMRPEVGGYVLDAQTDLDTLFPGLPDGKEADLEGLDAVDGRVWVCGSHARVRRKRDDGSPDAGFRRCPTRHLLGAVTAHGDVGKAFALPFTDAGSLRRRLRDDTLLADFMNLPSKENGFDVEGLAASGPRLFIGLRGPVVAGQAVVVQLRLRKDGTVGETAPVRHLLDLGGLGVRDLAREGDDILVLAGPVTSADGRGRVRTQLIESLEAQAT